MPRHGSAYPNTPTDGHTHDQRAGDTSCLYCGAPTPAPFTCNPLTFDSTPSPARLALDAEEGNSPERQRRIDATQAQPIAARDTFEEAQEAADADECDDTRLLTFEHAHGLLMEGYTLTAPAIRNLPEATYRIGGLGRCFIDGEETDHDTFATCLAADCADAE